jgi:hypothetical protein
MSALIAGLLVDVYLKECIVAWGKQALAGCGRRSVRNEKDGYTIPITRQPALVTFLLQEDDFLTVRDNRLCACHVQPAQGTQQETNIPMCSFLEECYARLCTPLSLCSVARHGGKCYATEVRVCADLINRIQVTAADIVAERPFFRQGLNLTSLWGMSWGTGRTLRTSLWLCTVQPVRYHTNKMYSKRSTLKWRLINATEDRIWYLLLQQGRQLTFYVKKGIVSISFNSTVTIIKTT